MPSTARSEKIERKARRLIFQPGETPVFETCMCAQSAQEFRFLLGLFQNGIIDCLSRPYSYFPVYTALKWFEASSGTYAAGRQPRAVRMDVY